MALAACVFSAEVQDQEAAEQYFIKYGTYPSWYTAAYTTGAYGFRAAYPYGTYGAYGYPTYSGVYPYGFRAYPAYGYGYSYGY